LAQSAIANIERGAHDATVGTLNRLLSSVGHSLTVIPTAIEPVVAWGFAIGDALESKHQDKAFRLLIGLHDALLSAPLAIRVALCVTPPLPCGDCRFDAALAGLVEFCLAGEELPLPTWIDETHRFLETPWEVTPYVVDDEVPQAFRRHGVFIAKSEFQST
jgi:hypothetical protein